jgi:transcriptional regulator with GAF, ATPase, and Fis domain
MRRRSRSGSEPTKAQRRKAKTQKAVRHSGSPVAGQETEVARFHRERDEALEREAATFEVLRLISKSPGNLELVFRSILENATRICEAKFGVLTLREGDALRVVAIHNAPPAYVELRTREPFLKLIPGTALANAVATKRASQTVDVAKYEPYQENPRLRSFVALTGARTVITVPLLKENEVIGTIIIYRQEVRSFTDKQVGLLTNFAAQAVIAIENARLLSELRQRTADLSESLEQQTATSEVLRVISSSPVDLEPVFRAMLENATRICEAKFGVLWRAEGENLFLGAVRQIKFPNRQTISRHIVRSYCDPRTHKTRSKLLAVANRGSRRFAHNPGAD